VKNIKLKQLSLFLAPVISTFLFISVLTVAPTTVIGDQAKERIKTTMGDLYPQKTQVADAHLPEVADTVSAEVAKKALDPQTTSVPSTSNIATSKATPAKTVNPSRSIPAKRLPPQPSRSISTSMPSTASSPQTKASAIIATSRQFIGVNYQFGGTTPSGFDCSGFVQYVFAKNDITLPRVSRDQFQVGTAISFANLKPGDLVFFGLAKSGVVDHEGIYVGNGQFINASSSKGITVYSLGSYWQSAFVGAKRVL